MRAGADVICFSGDKLLGGPQAGIAIGKKACIEAMKKNQFARVVRIDKLTLAALETTLRFYQDPALAARSIPVLSMLGARPEELEREARSRASALEERFGAHCAFTVAADNGEVGGGSLPGVPLPTWVVELSPHAMTVDQLEQRLRLGEPPIVGRIRRDRYVLDVRTLTAADWDEIEAALSRLFNR